jgi:hypothetical protein
MTAGADAWFGSATFGSGGVAASWMSSPVRRGAVFVLRGGVDAVTDDAPLAIWAAADTGHVRAALLRAHPALDGGRLDVRRLGRWLAHAGGEAQRWWPGTAPVSLGAALFVDTARTGRPFQGDPRTDVDAGVGLRLAVPGTPGTFRVDVARGLRDGHGALSVAWEP